MYVPNPAWKTNTLCHKHKKPQTEKLSIGSKIA